MIRVVHVITDLGYGGAQGTLAQLMSATRDRFEHHVVSLRDLVPGAERFATAASLTSLEMRQRRPSAGGALRLMRLLGEIDPAVAVTWLYHADLLGGFAARWARVPVCWNVRHGAPQASTTRPTTRLVLRMCAALSGRVPRAIVFNSRNSQAAHESLGYDAGRSCVIPNGVDLRVFRPDGDARAEFRQELGIAEGARLVGMAGRWCADKDFETFFACAAQVSQIRPEAQFVVCGQGVTDMNPWLRDLVDRYQLAPRIRLLGVRRDMPRVLAALDVLVCSSRTEAFPNVVLEALACGVPCVSTDVGDVREIVGPAGCVAPVGDAGALAAACDAILGWRGSLAAAALRQAARFAREAMIEQHARLWEHVARVPRKAAA